VANDCPALQDLDGFARITRVPADVASTYHLHTNTHLCCCSLTSLLSSGCCCSLCAGISTVANNCPAPQDLDGFARITRVPGNLQLYLLGSFSHLLLLLLPPPPLLLLLLLRVLLLLLLACRHQHCR
jgi:hypothetical protein